MMKNMPTGPAGPAPPPPPPPQSSGLGFGPVQDTCANSGGVCVLSGQCPAQSRMQPEQVSKAVKVEWWLRGSASRVEECESERMCERVRLLPEIGSEQTKLSKAKFSLWQQNNTTLCK